MNEYDLVSKYRKAKETAEDLKDKSKEANSEFVKAQAELIEDLESRQATATAQYEGLGKVTITKPRLYASVSEENKEQLFQYLSQIDRHDLIKRVVQPQSLSAFVSELMEGGTSPPDCISYYMKSQTRFTNKGA